MNYRTNNHYTNEHGVDLNTYLQHTFNYESLKGWYTMQVLKYLVRAGKKDGESYDKDRDKALDYAGELASLINEQGRAEITRDELMDFVRLMANDFKNWKGE